MPFPSFCCETSSRRWNKLWDPPRLIYHCCGRALGCMGPPWIKRGEAGFRSGNGREVRNEGSTERSRFTTFPFLHSHDIGVRGEGKWKRWEEELELLFHLLDSRSSSGMRRPCRGEQLAQNTARFSLRTIDIVADIDFPLWMPVCEKWICDFNLYRVIVLRMAILAPTSSSSSSSAVNGWC